MSELSSRVEEILASTIAGVSSDIEPKSRVEFLLNTLNSKIQLLANAKDWIGITTTALTDGSNTNPITINGESVTAVSGDITSYNGVEFIYNGSVWQEFGQKTKVGSITLGTTWTEDNDIYSQTVTVTGVTVTSNGKVDLQPTIEQVSSLMDDKVLSLVINNNNGTLTCYALGATPSASMTIQVTITEVTA